MIRRAEKAESELKALARQSRMIRFVECLR